MHARFVILGLLEKNSGLQFVGGKVDNPGILISLTFLFVLSYFHLFFIYFE
jgi:hypothetical protein